MTITGSQIRNLREKTGHALVACRDALHACKGYADLAERWLDVKGLAIATQPGRAPHQLVEEAATARAQRENQ